jgi:hypothetical protein
MKKNPFKFITKGIFHVPKAVVRGLERASNSVSVVIYVTWKKNSIFMVL